MKQTARPIDANVLLHKECCGRISGADVRNAPTLDYTPVRHGEWTFVEAMEGDEGTEIAERCSLCGRFVYRYEGTPQDDYCPKCGAKMDGGLMTGRRTKNVQKAETQTQHIPSV